MRLAQIALALSLFSSPAAAQAIPNHADPDARDVVPNLSSVPALRFLTTTDYPPFNFRDPAGELVGFNVDLARALCADLSVACTIQAWPWEQAPKALADNQGDALIAGLAVDATNGAEFDFSAVYLMLPGRFVVASGKVAGFEPSVLNGKKVGVRRGTAHATFLRRYLPDLNIVEFDNEPTALDALAAGEVDAVFADALRASFWLNAHPVDQGGCCSFAGDPYFRPDLFGPGLAMAIAPGRDAVRQAIDYGLGRLKHSGVYDELYLRWFPVSFY